MKGLPVCFARNTGDNQKPICFAHLPHILPEQLAGGLSQWPPNMATHWNNLMIWVPSRLPFKDLGREFHGSPVIRALQLDCRGLGFDLWSGN